MNPAREDAVRLGCIAWQRDVSKVECDLAEKS
jgi:hypothetical protein